MYICDGINNCSLLSCCSAVRMWNVKSGQFGAVFVEKSEINYEC